MIPNVRDVIASALSAITTSIYRGQASEDAIAPYVVWTIVSGVPENNVSGAPETDNARIQIDCYSDSQPQARQMAYAAMGAVEADSRANVIFGPVESRETNTKLWRWQFDSSWWSNR